MVYNSLKDDKYQRDIAMICINCKRPICWEDRSVNASIICPYFKEERSKILEKYKKERN